MGDKRKTIEPTSEGQLIRALQQAYTAAGTPGTRQLAEAVGISPNTVALALSGRQPKAVKVIEDMLAALGYEVQLKFVGKARVGRDADVANPTIAGN